MVEVARGHLIQPLWWSRATYNQLPRTTSRQLLRLSKEGVWFPSLMLWFRQSLYFFIGFLFSLCHIMQKVSFLKALQGLSSLAISLIHYHLLLAYSASLNLQPWTFSRKASLWSLWADIPQTRKNALQIYAKSLGLALGKREGDN